MATATAVIQAGAIGVAEVITTDGGAVIIVIDGKLYREKDRANDFVEDQEFKEITKANHQHSGETFDSKEEEAVIAK